MAYINFVLPDGSEVAFETAEDEIIQRPSEETAPGPRPVNRRKIAPGPQPVDRLEESSRSFEGALNAVSRMAGTLVTKFRDALPESPDELEIEFGLKASLEVNGFMVAKAGSEASYSVKMKWGKSHAGSTQA